MDLYSQQYPSLYHRGRVTTFTRSDSRTTSYFGGPGLRLIQGKKHGTMPLHHLATISTSDAGIRASRFGDSIPFFYGMSYSGCELDYQLPPYDMKVASSPWIHVTHIDPATSSDRWPYADYPKLLPYIPLAIKETAEMPLETFSDYVMQGIEAASDDELILVVPPNAHMGVSLWGPRGDAEDVQIIFIYNIQSGSMRAYNACT